MAKVKAYANLYDLDLIAIIVDRLTAKTLDRPDLQRALHMLDTGEAKAMLVPRLDRLTRSVKDLGELLDRYFAPDRYDLMSVNEQLDTRSAAGRLVMNILTSVAQWERETIGERTSAALQHLRDQGRYTGGQVRYGFKVGANGKRLEQVPGEQEIIGLARDLRGKGRSLRATADSLNEMGCRTRTGGRFQAVQVRNMLAA